MFLKKKPELNMLNILGFLIRLKIPDWSLRYIEPIWELWCELAEFITVLQL